MTLSAEFNRSPGFPFACALFGLLSLGLLSAHAEDEKKDEPAPTEKTDATAAPTPTELPALPTEAPPERISEAGFPVVQESKREWYVEWGYHRAFWAPSDIHVKQPGLGNDFTIHGVHAQDFPQQLISNDLTVPQFNLRVGKFLNANEDLAIEFSLDHTKYSTIANQTAHVTGTINGAPVDQDMVLTPSTFSYKLHNGANHVMMNLVKRKPVFGPINRSWTLSALFKGGVGIMLPHAENTVFGNNVDVGRKSWGNMVGTNSGWWRLNGWTIGGEVTARLMTWKPVFLDFSEKVAYASLGNVPVYQGKADQKLWVNEIVCTLGVAFGAKSGGP